MLITSFLFAFIFILTFLFIPLLLSFLHLFPFLLVIIVTLFHTPLSLFFHISLPFLFLFLVTFLLISLVPLSSYFSLIFPSTPLSRFLLSSLFLYIAIFLFLHVLLHFLHTLLSFSLDTIFRFFFILYSSYLTLHTPAPLSITLYSIVLPSLHSFLLLPHTFHTFLSIFIHAHNLSMNLLSMKLSAAEKKLC